jgi:hypothetical protein
MIAQPQTVAVAEIAPSGTVVGIIDFRAPTQGDSVSLHELNRRAIALGADTVVGAQIEHMGDQVHVKGIAVRHDGEGTRVAVSIDDAAPATVPMYDDSQGPSGAPPRRLDRAECPQCYVATRFSHPGFSGFGYARSRRWGY